MFRVTAAVWMSLFAMGLKAEDALRRPVVVQVPITQVFTIGGQDANDNAILVVRGTFPNTCHQAANGEASVNYDTNTITVSAYAYYNEEPPCLDILVPFTYEISMGPLPAGSYKVARVNSPVDTKVTLTIDESTTQTQDNYIYAPIDYADIVQAEHAPQKLLLRGVYPLLVRGCMALAEVKTFLSGDDNNILVVMPIARVLPEESCKKPLERRFEVLVDVPTPLNKSGLLHVRRLNGQSLSRYIEL